MKSLTLLSSILAFVSAASDDAVKTPGPSNLARDAATLQAFARTVEHDPKGFVKTWFGPDPCKFKGIICDKRPDGVMAVSGVDINGAKLKGNLKLTNLIEKLTDITFFHANSNEFGGEFPDVSHMQWLFEIDLSNNKLTGEFPKAILKASQLTFIDLRYNDLHGHLPPSLFDLDVDVIFLNNNKFSGHIPSEIAKSPVHYLTLANNNLSGPIPASIAKMKGLKEGLFMNNAFTGAIPEKLCEKAGIDILDFEGNKFSEPLGPACAALKKAKKLKI